MYTNPGLAALYREGCVYRDIESQIGRVLDGLVGSYGGVVPDKDLIAMVARQIKRALKDGK